MATPSLQNRRGFFSDYWLGTMAARRETAAPKLTAARLDKLLWRVTQLVERMDSPEPSALTDFREKFARPLVSEFFGYSLSDSTDEPRFRSLHPQANGVEVPGMPAVAGLWLCPDPETLDDREPRQHLENLIGERGLTYGFILTPQVLRLIRRRGEGAKGSAFDVMLAGIAETQDRASLDAARRLLHAGNFVPDSKGRSVIAEIEAESLKHRAKVSGALKDAVFRAAEIVIRGFRTDFDERGGSLPSEPSLTEQRDLGLLVLYRLLFILYAESRDERLQTHALYRKQYSLESLVARLLETPAGTLARNKYGLWSILQATFRIFDEGLPPLPELENIPPRGGPLFSRDTPEGRWIERLRLCDSDAADLLFALATAQPRRGVGRERISYRELAIEQLGSVYEGLLEYEPRVATEPMFALRVQGHEFVLAPSELQRLCREKELELAGLEELLSDPALEPLHAAADFAEDQAETEEVEEEEETGDEADDESEGEAATAIKNRAKARLLRRLETGEFFFAPGSARKSSGSYYTVDEIVQYLCRHALGGLVEGRSAEETLRLRVIDIACGSAHFLVGAARFLGKALWEAYHREHGAEPPPEFLPDHQLEKRAKAWEAEGEAWCKRRVVEQCLYGVDLNPTAVQLAQVALWIESLAGDRPLSFFAHHIRNGNSLLGSTLARLDEPPLPDLQSGRDAQMRGLFEHNLREEIAAALQQRRLIDAPLPPDLRADTPEEYTYKQHRLDEAEKLIRHARLLFDLRSAAAFVPAIWPVWTALVGGTDLEAEARQHSWWPEFERARDREKFFHWELEFPEVFFGEQKGFDAILGNPPWDKVLPAKIEFYASYDVLIRAYKGTELDRRIRELHDVDLSLEGKFAVYQERTKTTAKVLRNGGDFPLSEGRTAAAHEDLSKFFLERATQLIRSGGKVGLLLPSVVYNGDGCAGLRQWLVEQATILKFYGFENRRRIFAIHASYKFVCLCFAKEKTAHGDFMAAFMRHDPAELELPGPHGWEVRLSADEVRWLSPESFAFLEFRGPRDREILLKMYASSVRLGANGPEGWGVEMFTDFAHKFVYNAARDKDLWTDPKTGRLFAPSSVLGGSPPNDPSELIERMHDRGFVPVYEGKHIEQFLFGLQPIRWWLSLELAQQKYGRRPIESPVLVFRETAANTNQRTGIALVLPAYSAAAHTLTGMEVAKVDSARAAAVINSFVFDFGLRMRTAGTHISMTYLRPMPVPPPERVAGLPTLPTIDGWTSPCNYVTDIRELWEPLWRSNRAVAEAYGLNAADFAHILASFPSFARKRPDFFAYLQQQCAAWAASG